MQRTGGLATVGKACECLKRCETGDGILDGSRLRPWFRAIAERLAR